MLRRFPSILARRRKNRGIVLLYHRIAGTGPDPYRMNVSPGRFAEQLDVLRQHARIVPLATIADAAERTPERAVAVTFDDAYLDNLTNAKPLLEQADARATVFATAAFGAEFWWDALERILLGPDNLPPELTLQVAGRVHHWTVADLTKRRRRFLVPVRISGEKPTAHGLLWRLHPVLLAAPPEERAGALAVLATWAGATDGAPWHRAMTEPELARLAAGGAVTIGAHTASHPRLAELSAAAQRHEIQSGRVAVEQAVDGFIRSFAYPYGQRGDYDDTTVAIVRDLGFDHACAAFPGNAARAVSSFELPRFWVEDWDGDTFAGRLRAWLR
jgi:peptidoglycan/xylan/chitin deacetylase (PgdA/CDA1 family)